jgi:hypothetical protein
MSKCTGLVEGHLDDGEGHSSEGESSKSGVLKDDRGGQVAGRRQKSRR